LVGIARDKGVSGYIGDGSNRWPAVYRLDAAHLFRLALEKTPAGSVLHAVADEGVPMRAIADVIGRHLDLPPAAESSLWTVLNTRGLRSRSAQIGRIRIVTRRVLSYKA
jgi:nucleoside-diphosphate-sugar epimerase